MNKEYITYFKFRNEIINGWKIVKKGNSYDIYTYTTCKKLGNWQLFFRNYNYEKLLKYFEANAINVEGQLPDCKDDYSKEWVLEESKWRRETYNIFKQVA